MILLGRVWDTEAGHVEYELSISLVTEGGPGSGFNEWPVTGAHLALEDSKICKQKTWAWHSKDSRVSDEALLWDCWLSCCRQHGHWEPN